MKLIKLQTDLKEEIMDEIIESEWIFITKADFEKLMENENFQSALYQQVEYDIEFYGDIYAEIEVIETNKGENNSNFNQGLINHFHLHGIQIEEYCI